MPASQSRRAYLTHHLRPPGLQVVAGVHAGRLVRRARGERRQVLAGPDPVAMPSTMWKVLGRLGVALTRAPGPQVAATLLWSQDTETAGMPGAVNGACTDIGKRRVEVAHRRVLGYGIAVDPTAHDGPMVRKSNVNARHDGTLVRGPIARLEDGVVYQRLVDAEHVPGRIEELRIPVCAGTVPLLFVKHRPVADRFAQGPVRAWIADPLDVLDPAELAGILGLCADMGLDVGEIDVLRDRHDGRVHVVDVNRTPWGPPLALGARGVLRAVDRLGAAFEAAWLAPRVP